MKNSEIKFSEWINTVIKVLNDAFSIAIECEYEQNVKLGYVFQSHGIYLHEYLGTKDNEDVYYFIMSDMESNFTTYKFKDKNYFEEIKKQLKDNLKISPDGEIEINLSDMIKNEWTFKYDINPFNSLISVHNKYNDNFYEISINMTDHQCPAVVIMC